MADVNSDTEKGIVLIVDDSPPTLLLMTKMLKEDGYTVLSAANGAEAIALAEEQNPHLILLDVMMPNLTGYEVCKLVKRNPETADIPVVFVSALTEVKEKVDGLKLGALDYITKPVEKSILLTKARSFVQLCQQHRANMALQKKQQKINEDLKRFSWALDNASDGVVFTDPNGQITFVNIAFGYLSKMNLADIKGQPAASLFPENNKTRDMFREAFRGNSVQIKTSLLRKGGEKVPIELRCSAIMNDLVQPTGLLFLITDLTEQRQAEMERERLEIELFHSQKLESVGQLAAGIAHEINTPIQFVGDNIRFMQDAVTDLFDLYSEQQKLLAAAKQTDISNDLIKAVEEAGDIADMEYLGEELPKAVSQSLDGVKRVSSIVLAMKEFAHPGSAEMSPANLNDAITTTVTVARNKWKYVADLETELDESLPPVPCLLGEFNQVILNLIVNAADAISDIVGDSGGKGRIVISTSVDDQYATVSIGDTGGGIPQSIQDRIFDPFFTTKQVGKGSGQGLAIARSVIVSKHNGVFDFETKEGEGTTFIIRLPLVAESEAENESS